MTDINDIVAQVKLATDYQINKQILREKILTDLHLPYNGGLFKVTPEIIVFANLQTLNEHFYLEDVYGNPIHIVSPKEFTELCMEQYQKVMNRWHQEHNELKQIRRV
jgi:hypothetical protein